METAKSLGDTRMNWIDWIKAIGMFLIVYGHTHPEKLAVYIYTFNVPLFFIVSGFLSKREKDLKIFLEKTFYNLILPVMIVVVVSYLWYTTKHLILGDYSLTSIFKFIIGSLVGAQAYLGRCWFVYTLIVLKAIYQFTPTYCEKTLTAVLLVIFTIIALILSFYKIHLGYSPINVFISYHFFCIGLILKKYKLQINNFHNIYVEVMLFFISLLFIYICGKYNGYVWVYINGYGENFLLYLIGGVSGMVLVYVISKWLNKIKLSIVRDISFGTIVILGFHYNLIGMIDNITSNKIIISIIIMLLFVPFIRFCEKYFPYVLGMYRAKKRI